MSLVAFGANEKGQLGLGDNNIRKDILSKIDVPLREIVSGGFHNIAIGENDVVYVWGYNYLYQLGLGDNTDRTIPHVLEGYKAKKVGAGQIVQKLTTLAEGKLLVFGDNEYGQLAQGQDDNILRDVPTPIELLADKTFEDIFVGGYFNIVKTVDGEYYGWGANSGALSIGDTDQKTVPQLINDFKDKKIKKLSAGNSHCLCLLEDGQVYAWGFNRAGQLGLGDFKNVANMTLVTALKDLQVADVFTAANSSLCLTQDGQIYVWGSNMQGELGLGDKKHRNTPTLLPFESPVKKVWASSSSSHWFVQLENEKIFGIGRNDKGQLGTADGTKFVPVELPELQGKVTNISAGSHHTFVWLS